MEVEFKDILKEFLEENNLTQVAFAKKIDIKQSQVSEWLKGKAKPGYDILKRMAIAFGTSADYFLGIKENY
ncbi:MAG: helix-turn-helix transcriptional regulator [Clostridia bacterium]|nr:helix-turn-helix transcriptional regulator [Clostridia bacterium]